MIVSNTSPVSNLALIDQLSLLQKIYKKVTIPAAVHKELAYIDHIRVQVTRAITEEWIEVKSATDWALVEIIERDLDKGEAEAIVLARELKAERLLIDERLGRAVALHYGLKVTGLLGMLTAAKISGMIPLVKPTLDSLIQQAGFRVDKNLYARILQDVGE